MTCQCWRLGARRVSGMRTEAQDHEASFIRTSLAVGQHSEQSWHRFRSNAATSPAIQGRMEGGHHALEEVATQRHETSSWVLGVQTIACLYAQQMRTCSSVERDQQSQHFQRWFNRSRVVHGQDGSCDKPHEPDRKEEL